MLKDRVISALIGIPVLLFLIYIGGIPLLIFVIILALLALFELHRLLGKMKLHVHPLLLYGSALIFPTIAFFAPAENEESLFFAGLIIYLLMHLLLLVLAFPKYGLGNLGASCLGSCYISVLLSFLILIRKIEPYGFQILLLVFILTWVCDIGAYLIGTRFGRRKLCSAVSPKKTVEGALGGLASCLIASYLFHLFFPILSGKVILLLAFTIGLVVQLGDLVESAIKRIAGVKDSGDLIPGHGGILDRFDSILFSAPAAYFFIKLIMF
ncbi:MAG: phosphatidate cytidylyltransferase [Thermacetogeniaceae bacterium]|nr:phosphatidate cytidylyltransferase [Syntrophomonadaceae bacterium]